MSGRTNRCPSDERGRLPEEHRVGCLPVAGHARTRLLVLRSDAASAVVAGGLASPATGCPNSPPRRCSLAGPTPVLVRTLPDSAFPCGAPWRISSCGLLGCASRRLAPVECSGVVVGGCPTGRALFIRASSARLRSCPVTSLAGSLTGVQSPSRRVLEPSNASRTRRRRVRSHPLGLGGS